jgi:hypothetical protein
MKFTHAAGVALSVFLYTSNSSLCRLWPTSGASSSGAGVRPVMCGVAHLMRIALGG